MKNFDLRKYIYNNPLLKEEVNEEINDVEGITIPPGLEDIFILTKNFPSPLSYPSRNSPS